MASNSEKYTELDIILTGNRRWVFSAVFGRDLDLWHFDLKI